ncbi:uncharacterized protein LOC143281387 [Babylonia areolata]|uniref:uncharacterized protein LOC143281387 n=1 Tax=Babylonia areolata TaxID=304850 RepID=UPI003FD63A88
MVSCFCEMYADDTKVYDSVEMESKRDRIQQDLDNLVSWADLWQLRFNASKCKVLHLGRNNPKAEYNMRLHNSDERVVLESSKGEKDLGVLMDQELRFRQHIETQVNKANRILGLIRRSYQYQDMDTMRQLFVALIHPHLEFANVAWSSRYQKDKDLIEGVLRRATKMVPGAGK